MVLQLKEVGGVLAGSARDKGTGRYLNVRVFGDELGVRTVALPLVAEELPNNCVMMCLYVCSAEEAEYRLKAFFPTADTETLLSVMRVTRSESKSVKRLLELGYPLKKRPLPRS